MKHDFLLHHPMLENCVKAFQQQQAGLVSVEVSGQLLRLEPNLTKEGGLVLECSTSSGEQTTTFSKMPYRHYLV
jgi:hypothetical protein